MHFSNQITLFEDAANHLFETVKTYKTVSQFTGKFIKTFIYFGQIKL